ncbi:MAG TPA: hypothetical protein VGQ42_12065 [Candidatus Dormibacteraeota bacterium]|jgi:hypothetical protein|nr:hypothetical protein [Candidatus Dormibacteraeota bacterium]
MRTENGKAEVARIADGQDDFTTRKALLRVFVEEVRIDGRDAIYPTFRIPADPVRQLVRVVGLIQHLSNREYREKLDGLLEYETQVVRLSGRRRQVHSRSLGTVSPCQGCSTTQQVRPAEAQVAGG